MSRGTKWRRWALRTIAALGLVVALLALIAAVSGWRAFGKGAQGARLERMKRSPQWQDGHFENPQPLRNDALGSIAAMWNVSPDASPHERLRVVEPAALATPPADGLRVTWFGHSSVLLEIDGHRILTDPVWSERASPLSWIGPRRWYAPPLPLDALPPIDAVVVSHDHYDHLDMRSIIGLIDKARVFIVPLGIGAHLEYWGVPPQRIVELDWWERHRVGDLEVVATPARHASGRALWDMNATLWAGYAFLGSAHRVYYSGDTGRFPAMKEIGERFGPFDLTMIEVGQYHQAWPDWHIGPEQAVLAHQDVRGRAMLPVHWAALMLAMHGWTEPVERARAAAAQLDVALLTPAPGQSFAPADPPAARWWPELSWVRGAQDPIVSTQLDP